MCRAKWEKIGSGSERATYPGNTYIVRGAMCNQSRVSIGLNACRADAEADFARGHELNEKDACAVLWPAMTGIREESSGWKARLEEQARNLSEEWTMPVAKFYAGRLTAEQMLAAAKDPDQLKQRGQACEAEFFLGEWQLGRGQKQGAIENLHKAHTSCLISYFEYAGSGVELRKLGALGQ